jgi:hypothetical protein
MNDEASFPFIGRDENPAAGWSGQHGDFDQLGNFGSTTPPLDFQFRHHPLTEPSLMDIDFPMPQLPLFGFSDAFGSPISAPPPQRFAPPSHKKVPSSGRHPDLLHRASPGPVGQSRHLRHSSLPDSPALRLDSDAEFERLCADPAIVLHPQKLGFIPREFWSNESITFGQLVKEFFQRKNHANSRFAHKLYNAVKIILDDPFYIEFVGIEWITDVVLRVDKKAFARLLAIKTIDGSLFHQQGNFPSHGFVELTEQTAMDFLSRDKLLGVDFDNIRLFAHHEGLFTKNITEEEIEQCKWVSAKKRTPALIETAE